MIYWAFTAKVPSDECLSDNTVMMTPFLAWYTLATNHYAKYVGPILWRDVALTWVYQWQVSIGSDNGMTLSEHNDVIKWKHFPHYWLFVRGIHRPPVNSPTKASDAGLWYFSLICAWINGWVNNREAGNLRRPIFPIWRHCNATSHYRPVTKIGIAPYN